MGKCIGGVVNDSVGDLLAHSPGNSLGNHSKTRMRLLLLLLLSFLFPFVPLSANQVLTTEDSSRKISFEYEGLGDH